MQCWRGLGRGQGSWVAPRRGGCRRWGVSSGRGCCASCCVAGGWRRARRPARRQSAGRSACCCGSRSARGASAVSSSCALGSARGASAVSGLASARRRAGGTFALCLSIERCFQPAGPPPPEAVGMPLGVVVRVLVLVAFVHVGLVGGPAARSRGPTSSPRPCAGSSRDSRRRVQARGLARSRSGSPPHSVRTRPSGQPSVSTPQPLLRALLALRLPARRCAPSAGFLARQTARWEGALTCACTRLNFSRPIRENRKHWLAGRIFYNFRHFERSIVSTKSAVEVQLRCPDGAPRDCEGEGGAFQARHGRRPS